MSLHREHRELPLAHDRDKPRLRLEDELFERLHAGELDAPPARLGAAPPLDLRGLPVFTRLGAVCRGDPAAAAAATETILRLLDLPSAEAPPPDAAPGSSGDPLRRPLAAACAAASRAADELREVTEGFAMVAFGNAPGTGTEPGARTTARVRPLAARLRRDPRRADEAYRREQAPPAQRVKHGADEIADIEQGADLGWILPAKLAKLSHPRRRLDLIRALVEREVLQYQLSGSETLGRGRPLPGCLQPLLRDRLMASLIVDGRC